MNLNEEESLEEYKCRRFLEIDACNSCDGFGRNLNNKINTEECYATKEHMKENMDLDKKYER